MVLAAGGFKKVVASGRSDSHVVGSHKHRCFNLGSSLEASMTIKINKSRQATWAENGGAARPHVEPPLTPASCSASPVVGVS